MNSDQNFEAVCSAMEQAEFYPHSVSGVTRLDTHISAVFLTGNWVYKLKKPLDLGFLDFRRLSDRRFYCGQEVRLNQRLSRNVYIGVVAVRCSGPQHYHLDGEGTPVEYAVKMRQLPEAASLRYRLAKNKIHPEQLDRLGAVLADFYRKSRRSREIDHYGDRQMIAGNMEENFRQMAPYVHLLPDADRWEFICQVNRAFAEDHRGLFQQRQDAGMICDGHGDLRTDHIYFYKGVQIIDCIEFNDRFRYEDPAADLAFLHMDMEHGGYTVQSRRCLFAYAMQNHDPGLYVLLDFYAAYRAVVRLKIACFRFDAVDTAEQARLRRDMNHYVHQAYRYTLQFSRPTLWVFSGLPASGKSTLAQKTASTVGASLLSSDLIRRELVPETQQGVKPFGRGIYQLQYRQRVYAEMLKRGQEMLRRGRPVILDATFSRAKWRLEARRLAADVDANLLFVECRCSEETLRRRLAARDEKKAGPSDARLPHLEQMIKRYEPLTELPSETFFRIDTDQPLEDNTVRVFAEGHAGKCSQIEAVIS